MCIFVVAGEVHEREGEMEKWTHRKGFTIAFTFVLKPANVNDSRVACQLSQHLFFQFPTRLICNPMQCNAMQCNAHQSVMHVLKPHLKD